MPFACLVTRDESLSFILFLLDASSLQCKPSRAGAPSKMGLSDTKDDPVPQAQLKYINSEKEASRLQSITRLSSAFFGLSKSCKLKNIKKKESKGKGGGHEEEEEGRETMY